MGKQIITDSQLRQVAQLLGEGWFYHSVRSKTLRPNHHVLSNGAGLYITVENEYKEPLPRWALSVAHPQHKYYQTIVVIGCSLDKSLSAIVANLKSRLLVHSLDAYKKLQALSDEYQTKLQERLERKYMLEALEKVLRLNRFHDHRYSDCFRVEDEKGIRLATLKGNILRNGSFNLTLENLTPEQVIKALAVTDYPLKG